MKVIFLDIDGVLCSYRSSIAYGGFPICLDKNHIKKFDHVAVNLIKKLCHETKSKIIISSTWRLTTPITKFKKFLNLPVIGVTPQVNGEYGRSLGVISAIKFSTWIGWLGK